MDIPQTNKALQATNGTPLWLLAELTYRCPLHCVYCYNPVDFALTERELDTDGWIRVLREARALGSVQCGFSGGEPMVREEVEAASIVASQVLTRSAGSTSRPACRAWCSFCS